MEMALGEHIEQLVTSKLSFGRGQEMGGFKLGSTVVLVFEAPDSFKFMVEQGQKVSLGDAIGKCQ